MPRLSALSALQPAPTASLLRPERRGPRRAAAAAAPRADAAAAVRRALAAARAALPLPGTAPAPATGADPRFRRFLADWDRGFMDCAEEQEGYFADVVFGKIPEALEGTLFRNGPARFSLGADGDLIAGEEGAAAVGHPYDGDGLVASLAIKNGRAFFRCRLVATPELAAERAAGGREVLFRGTFGTQRPGGAAANAGDLFIKNPSNTNVVEFGGALWSLWEAGAAYALDPRSLATKGLEALGGRLTPGAPFDLGSPAANAAFASLLIAPAAARGGLPPARGAAGGDAVTAHPRYDAASGRLVLFSYRVLPGLPATPGGAPVSTKLTFYELEAPATADGTPPGTGADGDGAAAAASEHAAAAAGGPRVAAQRDFSLPAFGFVHDFCLTRSYYVVFQNPVFVDNAPYLLGQAPAAACVRDVRGAPTVVHLVPRPGAPPGVEARSFLLPGFFVFHHANAFEEYSTDDSTKDLSCSAEASPTSVTIDSIHYDSMPAVGREALAAQRLDPDAAFRPRLRRLELDLLLGAVRARRSFDGYLEMPSVAPEYSGRRHRYVYGYHSVFEDPSVGVAKVDVGGGGGAELWLPGARRFALEPVFAPRARADGAEAAEDEGWLICQLWDAERSASEFIVLDAADLGAGPVAVVRLRAPLPSALHACWSESYYGPDVGGGGGAAAPVGAVAPSEAARLRGTRRAVAPGAAA